MLRSALLKTWIEVRRRPLLLFLLQATLAFDSMVMMHGLQRPETSLLAYSMAGCVQGQIALLAWWVVQPKHHALWRLAFSLALIPYLGLCLLLPFGIVGEVGETLSRLPATIAIMMFTVVLIGGCGIRWIRFLFEETAYPLSLRAFSISDLLASMTCVSIVSVLFGYFDRHLLFTSDWLYWLAVLFESSIALACLAFSSWLPRVWAGWVGAAVFLPMTVVLSPWMNWSTFSVYASLNAACCVTIALWIAGLRQGRVKRRAINTQQPSSTPAVAAQAHPQPAPVAPIDLTG